MAICLKHKMPSDLIAQDESVEYGLSLGNSGGFYRPMSFSQKFKNNFFVAGLHFAVDPFYSQLDSPVVFRTSWNQAFLGRKSREKLKWIKNSTQTYHNERAFSVFAIVFPVCYCLRTYHASHSFFSFISFQCFSYQVWSFSYLPIDCDCRPASDRCGCRCLGTCCGIWLDLACLWSTWPLCK